MALLEAETLLEAIDASAGVYQLLLAGVERMALGANINLHLFLCRPGLKRLTAYAANDALAILGMDLFLHCSFTSFAYAMIGYAASDIITHIRDHCKGEFTEILLDRLPF